MNSRYGSPIQENGKITRLLNNTWCHQCKIKHEKIVVCDHFWDTNRSTKCNGRYCSNCCNRHYGKKLTDLEKLDTWICFKCSSQCVCAACRRMRNPESEDINPNKNIKKRSNVSLSKESDNLIYERKRVHTENIDHSLIRDNRQQQNYFCYPRFSSENQYLIKEMPNNNHQGSSIYSPFEFLLQASMQSMSDNVISSSDNKSKGDIQHLLNPEESEIQFIDPINHDNSDPIYYGQSQVLMLKQEVNTLQSEIHNMKNDFINLQNLFQSYLKGNGKFCV